MTERSLAEIDWRTLTGSAFQPSPPAWEDEVFYFLLLDRFSDGRERDYRGNDGEMVAGGETPLLRPSDTGNAIRTESDASRWRDSGSRWAGGTLQGLTSKLGYLQRLGVTAVWVSPVFKQVAFEDSYHGYGVQDFLGVDPHFGTRDDLKEMVRTAHALGIRVVLDIILNHSGNVFRYRPDRYWTKRDGTEEQFLDPRWDGSTYEVEGFHDEHGNPTLPFGRLQEAHRAAAWPNGAVWPEEFQSAEVFTRKGHISNWDYDPEFREGDFASLKDITLGRGADRPVPAVGRPPRPVQGVQVLDGVRRRRRLSGRHRQAHGPGCRALLRGQHPRVRAAARQGELLPDRRGRRRARAGVRHA